MDASRALTAIAEADPASLDVSADLTASVDGHEITVDSYTDRVLVDVPTVGVAAGVLRRTRGLVPGVARVLAAADLTAIVRVRGSRGVVVGSDAESGRLSRRIGAPVKLDARGGAATAFRAALSRL